jgi:hypothetical protein
MSSDRKGIRNKCYWLMIEISAMLSCGIEMSMKGPIYWITSSIVKLQNYSWNYEKSMSCDNKVHIPKFELITS